MTAGALGGVALAATAAAVLTMMFTRRRRPTRPTSAVTRPPRSRPETPHTDAAMPAEQEGFPPDASPSGAESPSEVVRFDVHVFFAERRETHLIVDVLADLADGRGGVLGVPASLILSRPPDVLSETLLLSLMEENQEQGCQVEVDLTIERASVKVCPAGRELSIPIRAASGLPLAS